MGRAGENFFCDMVTQSLEEAGVSTDFLIRDKENHTGTVVVLVDSEGQNAMVPDYGANLHLSAGDIERAADAIRSSDMLSFSSRYRKMLTFELSRLQRIVRFRSCSILLRGFLPALSF